jgi:hypothetical protein
MTMRTGSAQAVLAVAAALLALAAACVPPPAAAQAPNLVQLDLSLANESVSLGQPILVKYRLTSACQTALTLDLGEASRSWIHLSITDAAGQPVATQPNMRGADGPTAEVLRGDGVGTAELPATGEYVEGWVPANEGAIIASPGQYTVSATVSLPFTLDGSPDAPEEVRTLQAQQSLPVVINARDDAVVGATASAYATDIAQGTQEDPAWLDAEVDALLSMAESDALPHWRAVAKAPQTPEGVFPRLAYDLTRIGSSGAVEVLGNLAWGDPATNLPAPYPLAQNSLSELAPVVDPTLRSQIEGLFITNVGSVPMEVYEGQPVFPIAPPPPPDDSSVPPESFAPPPGAGREVAPSVALGT